MVWAPGSQENKCTHVCLYITHHLFVCWHIAHSGLSNSLAEMCLSTYATWHRWSNLTVTKLKVLLVRKWITVFPCSSPCLPSASPCLLFFAYPLALVAHGPFSHQEQVSPPHQRRACLNQSHSRACHPCTFTRSQHKYTTMHSSVQSQIKASRTLTHTRSHTHSARDAPLSTCLMSGSDTWMTPAAGL